jgi:DNA polymerase III subunit delta
MRISSEQLAPHLARELRPLYTIFGDEPLLALEACDLIRAKARAEGYIEREILTTDAGFKWPQLMMAANSQSLFASQKLLELRIPNGKPGVEGGQTLQSFCVAPPADTVTLVYLPALDWRAQKAGWFEALDRAGVTVEAKAVTRKALPQWLAARLAAQGQTADAEALAFITERVEGNLMAAFQEVQKLALLFPKGPLAFEQVREAVLDVARYDVFNLGVAMVEGDPLRLARMIDGLQGEGTAPPMALWSLAEEIRAIGRVLAAAESGRPLATLWREAKVWGAAHQNIMQQNISRFTAAQVAQGLRHAAAIDRMVKGLAKGDVWDELLHLALRFARGARTAATAGATTTRPRATPTAAAAPALF